MRIILAVAFGGAVGATARYLMAGQVGRWFGTNFPWGTLAVNVLGCLIMGLLVELMALKWSVTPGMRAFLTVGVLGGFTTFSSFALDTATLAARHDTMATGFYVAGSVALSILGFYAGMILVRHLVP
jgi:CrcB protein